MSLVGRGGLRLLGAIGVGVGSVACASCGVAAFWLAHVDSALAAVGVAVILYVGPLLVLSPIAWSLGLSGREAAFCSLMPAISFGLCWSLFVVVPADNPTWVPWATVAVLMIAVGVPSALLTQVLVVVFPKR